MTIPSNPQLHQLNHLSRFSGSPKRKPRRRGMPLWRLHVGGTTGDAPPGDRGALENPEKPNGSRPFFWGGGCDMCCENFVTCFNHVPFETSGCEPL